MRRKMVSAVSLLLACGIALVVDPTMVVSPARADSSPTPLSLSDLQGFGIRAGKAVDQPPALTPPAVAPTVVRVAPTPAAAAATVRPQPRPLLLLPAIRPALAEQAPEPLSTGQLQAIAIMPVARQALPTATPATVEPASTDERSPPPVFVPTAKPADAPIEAAAPEPPPPAPSRPVRLGADGLIAVGLSIVGAAAANE